MATMTSNLLADRVHQRIERARGMCSGNPNTCGYDETCPSDRETPMCRLTGGCCNGRVRLPKEARHDDDR